MKLATKQRVIPEVRGHDLKRSNSNIRPAIHERERKFISEECEWSSKFLTLVDFVQYVKGRKYTKHFWWKDTSFRWSLYEHNVQQNRT